MSIHIETVPAKYATVHRVERGEELVEDYEDTVVTEEVALALSYDEVVSIEGTEKRVNLVAARMLASVPAGPYVPVSRARMTGWAEELERAAGADTDSLSDMADSLEIVREVADALRNLLQR